MIGWNGSSAATSCSWMSTPSLWGSTLSRCSARRSPSDVLLAVIGPNWLNARDEDGNRRLDNPQDFVRIEIGAALQRNISVIPILLDGAKVPKANQLPKELEELSLRNGLDIRHASFHNDVDRLIRGLKGQLANADAEKRRRDEDERRQQEAKDRRRLDEAAAKKRRQDKERRKLEKEEAWAAKKAQAPHRWREAAAGVVVALLLVGGTWLYLTTIPAGKPQLLGIAAEAEARAKAEQAEKERLAAVQAEEGRKAKAAADAEAIRKAAEAEQQRLKEELQRQGKTAAQPTPTTVATAPPVAQSATAV